MPSALPYAPPPLKIIMPLYRICLNKLILVTSVHPCLLPHELERTLYTLVLQYVWYGTYCGTYGTVVHKILYCGIYGMIYDARWCKSIDDEVCTSVTIAIWLVVSICKVTSILLLYTCIGLYVYAHHIYYRDDTHYHHWVHKRHLLASLPSFSLPYYTLLLCSLSSFSPPFPPTPSPPTNSICLCHLPQRACQQ